jgi:Uma2 family endonuclease
MVGPQEDSMAEHGSYVRQIAELFPVQGKWTEEDYFALPEVNRIIELSDGEIIMSPPPKPSHQRTVHRLAMSLTNFVDVNELGEVLPSPIAVRLWKGRIRGPDLLFLRTENLAKIGDTYIDGGPDWVAEVISPRSRQIDTVEKLEEYALAGILEYWILDPRTKSISVYVLEKDTFRLAATYNSGDIAESATILGFTIAADEVFR